MKQIYQLSLIAVILLTFQIKSNAQSCGASNNIGGTIYGDFNSNGLNDETLTEVEGVSISAYNASGTLLAQTTSNEDGEYVLPIANGTDVRLEFTNIPTDLYPSSFGNNSGTSIQFVASPTCSADLGLTNYANYCEGDVKLAMPCFVNGDPLAGGNAGAVDAIVGFAFSSRGNSPSVDHHALANQVGATWGTAWDRSTQSLFASTILKRHSGFGPQGIGGIYLLENLSGSATVTNYMDLSGCISLGSVNRPDLSTNVDGDNYDEEAYLNVGKMGLGALSLSDDGLYLWTINLNSKTLVRIQIRTNPTDPINMSPSCGDVTEYALPNGCGSEMRPWAVEFHKGKVYVGTVCSSSLSADAFTFDPDLGTFSSSIFNFSLVDGVDIDKGCTTFENGCGWTAWTDSYPTSVQGYGGEIIAPQPIFSDIEFDLQDNMVVGFMDRFGHQTGFNNYFTPGSQSRYSGNSGGDLYYAFNNGGTYIIENNGNLVDGSGNIIKNGCGGNPSNGIEFFCAEDWESIHKETALGATAVHLGNGKAVSPVFDPISAFSGGTLWSNLNNGSADGYNQLYTGGGSFGKAAGLGDPSFLCGVAPLEIGNYVWYDRNADGVMDAGEPGIEGIEIHLLDASGNFLATTNTSPSGQYFFSSATTPALQAETEYYILVPNYTTILTGTTFYLTGENTTTDKIDSDGLIVSSGVPTDVLNKPYINLTTGNYGENNHSYDFGFTGCDLSVTYGVNINNCLLAADTLSVDLNVFVEWSQLGIGDDLEITVGTQTVTHTVASISGVQSFVFSGISAAGTIELVNLDDANCSLSKPYTLPNYVSINNLNTGTCSFDINSLQSTSELTFDVSWADLSGGDVLTVQVGDQSQTINVGAAAGSESMNFTVLADGSADNSIIVTSQQNSCAYLNELYDAENACPECVLKPINVIVGECESIIPGTSQSDLEVEVFWANATNGDNLQIEVEKSGSNLTDSHTVGSTSGTHTFVFTVPANGSVNNDITLSWSSGAICNILTSTYDARLACPSIYDIALTKTVNTNVTTPSGTVTFMVTAVNQGDTEATNIDITDFLPTGMSYGSPSATKGSFSTGTGIWTISSLAPAELQTLTIPVTMDANAFGVYDNVVEVTNMNEIDADSEPNNKNKYEDDIAKACVTVPIEFCDLDSYTAMAESGYFNYQWYKNTGSGPVAISGATDSVYTISEVGSFTYSATTALSGGVAINNCCAIIIQPASGCSPNSTSQMWIWWTVWQIIVPKALLK